MRSDETGPADGELTAYLDNALSADERAALDERLRSEPGLRERLEWLERGARPFREAYDTLLPSAPLDRLRRGLDQALAAVPEEPATATIPWKWRGGLPAAIAAGLFLFVLGFGAGHVANFGPQPGIVASDEDALDQWRDVVADYFGLTTSQTLVAMPRADQVPRDLGILADRLGIDLSRDRLALAGHRIVRVDLYHYDNAPLGEIVYLDEENGPIAFCILKREQEPEAPEAERRRGMNLTYWTSGDHAFMLIGRAPEEVLTGLANELRGRIGA